MYERVYNSAQAIDSMGGTYAVARKFDPPVDPRVVSNWRTRGFPPETYAVLFPILSGTAIFDPYKLFRQYQPARGKNGNRPRR